MAKKILVSNLDPITSEDDLFDMFAEFGEVESAIIRDEPDPDKDTFTGEIVMEFESDAIDAVRELDGEQIDGRWIYVRFLELDKKKEKSLPIDEIEEQASGDTFEVIQKKKKLKG
ncbi:MAG: RNA-binding protein [Bacteroidia bacterium]|nr:RNA-binding protein [Bacteroidia bacterium]